MRKIIRDAKVKEKSTNFAANLQQAHLLVKTHDARMVEW